MRNLLPMSSAHSLCSTPPTWSCATRERIEALLDEALGWTGNGLCDGSESGSGRVDFISLVVDTQAAVETIVTTLRNEKLLAQCSPQVLQEKRTTPCSGPRITWGRSCWRALASVAHPKLILWGTGRSQIERRTTRYWRKFAPSRFAINPMPRTVRYCSSCHNYIVAPRPHC